MRVIVVYHRKAPHFLNDEPVLAENFVRDFVPIAAVGFRRERGELLDFCCLEESFRLTNTVDHPWWENDTVTPLFVGDGWRSTSIGDVLYDCASGAYWKVKALGFERIFPEDV